jgi:hypothetical protein
VTENVNESFMWKKKMKTRRQLARQLHITFLLSSGARLDWTRLTKGIPNPDSTHKVYMSKTLSQETMFSNVDFLPWSLSNIPLRSSTPALLNKRTSCACGQPHRIRTGFVLCVDLESNLDLVSKISPLSHH